MAYNPLMFFSLETLDARLDNSGDPEKKQKIQSQAHPSRWHTLEFKIYLILFCIVVPWMFKTAMEASNETNPNYYIYQGILSEGWIFGRKVDNSDSQYRFFRDNFPMLVALMGLHWSIRKISLHFKVRRTLLDLIFGLVFLFAAHGFNSLRILIHLGVEYFFGKVVSKKSKKLAVALLWVYGIGTLFINDKYRSVKFSSLWEGLQFMDSFHGIIERWDVFFNFTILRMLSFNLDYLKRKDDIMQNIKSNSKAKTSEEDHSEGIPLKEVSESQPVTPVEQTENISYLNERQRLYYPLDLSEYNFANYLSFVLYTPLFIAGPIITFNDYMYQSSNTLPSINWKRTLIYGARLLFCILTMEFILHYIYVVAVSKAKAWYGDTPFQISMIGFFNLNIIWLKLLIPWRLFRFWALCDGIDPPENMIRCMDNNYSAMQFWRAWHRSYNKWVIRYIYIPLGGGTNRILASLAVFSFVAIWHDIELRLLIWGWLIVFFLLPEILITQVARKYQDASWYRHACAFGGIVNIWLMMLANLFGFCLGKDGILQLLHDMFYTTSGFVFFIGACASLWIGCQVMFEIRESEIRRGIYVKC